MKKSRSFNKLLINNQSKKPSHERRFSRQFYSNFQQNWSGSPTPSRSFLNLNSLRFDSRTKSYCTGVGFEGYGIIGKIKFQIHTKINNLNWQKNLNHQLMLGLAMLNQDKNRQHYLVVKHKELNQLLSLVKVVKIVLLYLYLMSQQLDFISMT